MYITSLPKALAFSVHYFTTLIFFHVGVTHGVRGQPGPTISKIHLQYPKELSMKPYNSNPSTDVSPESCSKVYPRQDELS